jgi:phytanoyl-CoA hydroxylase
MEPKMTAARTVDAWFKEIPWIDRPDADIDRFVSQYKTDVSFDLHHKLRSWRDDGFVIFEGVVRDDLIDEFLQDIQHLRDHFHDYTISIEVGGAQTYSRAVRNEEINAPGVKFNHLHTHSRAAARLSLVRPVAEFLGAIFEAPPVAMQSLTFWRGSQQPTHIDYPYVNMQRRLPYLAASWIPLEDVHPDSGPLAYFPGGHRIEISGFFDWGDGSIVKTKDGKISGSKFAEFLDERMKRANINPVTFCPRRGDVLIWHGNLPHTGTRVRDMSMTRKSYVTHFSSVDDYPLHWKPPASEMKTRSVNENGGFVYELPWTKSTDKLPSWRACCDLQDATSASGADCYTSISITK